jgi:hypothetical protein
VGQANLDAVWSPDGKRIAYTSVRNGKYAFFAKAADGMLLQSEAAAGDLYSECDRAYGGSVSEIAVSAGGAFVLARREVAGVLFDGERRAESVCAIPWTGRKKAAVAGRGDTLLDGGRTVRNFLFVGRQQDYVGGNEGRRRNFSSDCGEAAVFETRVYRYNGGHDVMGDGQKFIVAYEAGQPNAVITLVENWDAELTQK